MYGPRGGETEASLKRALKTQNGSFGSEGSDGSAKPPPAAALSSWLGLGLGLGLGFRVQG